MAARRKQNGSERLVMSAEAFTRDAFLSRSMKKEEALRAAA